MRTCSRDGTGISMNAFTVVLALLCASANAASTVFQRRGAVEHRQDRGRDGARSVIARLAPPLERPAWWVGAAAVAAGAVLHVLALDKGGLTVVEPLLASELLFALLIGTAVFHDQPGLAAWLAFLMLGCGLAGFLLAASPKGGTANASGWRWLAAAGAVACCMAASITAARRVTGAARSAFLGIATAIGFAATAALIKGATGSFSGGLAAVLTTWQTYVAAAMGLASMLLLQWTLRSGTLTVSQPALTIGDALISVVFGIALFREHISLGWRLLPEALAAALIVAGVIGITQTPAATAEESWDHTT